MALTRRPAPEELLEAVRATSCLKEVGEEALLELVSTAISHDYPKNNILFYRGEASGAVFLVVKGKVKLILDSEEGREVMVTIVRPGGFVGLVSAMDGGPHPATAVVLTKSRLAKLRAESLVAWLARHPVATRAVGRELVARLREAYQRIGEHALLGVKERLWATLLEIADLEGEQAPGGGEIVFTRPTHQELAERIGSSREVVTRVLKELLESEVLEAEGRIIRVPGSALILRDELE